MPRVKPSRQPCDCNDCNMSDKIRINSSLSSAIARQEPPPKSAVIIIDGALDVASARHADDDEDTKLFSFDAAHCAHLDSVVRDGCSGLLLASLGLKSSTPSQHTMELPPRKSLALQIFNGTQQPSPPPLPHRFQSLNATLLTDSSTVRTMGNLKSTMRDAVGFSNIFTHASSHDHDTTTNHWFPTVDTTVNYILSSLRVKPLEKYVAQYLSSDADLSSLNTTTTSTTVNNNNNNGNNHEDDGDDEADMAVVWLTTPPLQPPQTLRGNEAEQMKSGVNSSIDDNSNTDRDFQNACESIEWLDRVVRALDAAPGFGETVLLTLVLTPSSLKTNEITQGLSQIENKLNQDILKRVGIERPPQSYEFSGVVPVAVDAHRPAVVVHRLPGVIRKDRVDELNVHAIVEQGGGRAILAERMLYDITYKIGRAPKYGA